MSEYKITFTVECETLEQAEQVVRERIGPDEDYGFPYTIDFRQVSVEDTNPAEMIVDGEDLRCPHCSATDGVYLIDVAWRENECAVEVEDEDTLTLMVTEGDGEFDTDHYECVGCRGLVSIPDSVDTSW